MVTPELVLGDVEVDGHRADVTVAGGVIVGITAPGTGRGADRIDGHGGALLPGLHDHHVHLLATAAARSSLDVGGLAPGDEAAFVAAVRSRIASSPTADARIVGYDEQVAGPLDRHALDRIASGARVRVQHRTGQLWVLSSAALRDLGDAVRAAPDGLERDADGLPTGRCWRIDAWLRDARVAAGRPAEELELRAALVDLGGELLARGVTGCTDATPFSSLAAATPLLDVAAHGGFGPRLTVTGGPDALGVPLPDGVGLGPVKLLFDDHDPPPFDDLVDAVRAARAADRSVAVHCVTRAGLALALAAIDAVPGPGGDRIEHGAVVPPETLPELRRLRLTVVTQPAFPVARGDRYVRDVDPEDLPHLWPCALLLAAGIPVAAGSDAPYGPLDPWRAIAAATSRRTADGRAVGSDPPIAAHRALALHLGSSDRPGTPRRVAVGAPADLALLDEPLDAALRDPVGVTPVAVLVADRRAC